MFPERRGKLMLPLDLTPFGVPALEKECYSGLSGHFQYDTLLSPFGKSILRWGDVAYSQLSVDTGMTQVP